MQKVKKKSKRIFYFDALRALAIISVIVYHVNLSIRFLVLKDFSPAPSFNWFVGDFFMNYARVGVDLFLMLAGALSLGRVWTVREFLGKRLPRIAEPYLFWIIVTMCIFLLTQWFFPEIIHVIDSFTFDNISAFVIQAFQSANKCYYSYWFFWMILGTYFFMPIINKWLLRSSIHEAEYFLAIWLITSLFTYTFNMDFPIKLSYFVSPIGFVILGYYLRHSKRKIYTRTEFAIFLMVLAFILEMGISLMLSTGDYYKFDRYSITMVIKAAGIFLLFKNLDEKNVFENVTPVIKNTFKKAVFSIAKYSYGFYLLHLCVLNILVKTLRYYTPFTHYKFLMFFISGSVLVICWLIMDGLNRVPYVKDVIGAK